MFSSHILCTDCNDFNKNAMVVFNFTDTVFLLTFLLSYGGYIFVKIPSLLVGFYFDIFKAFS